MKIESVIQKIKELDPADNPKYSQFNDISLSRLFADIFKNEVRFNTTHNSYDKYDGKVWRLDEGNMQAEHCMKQFSLALWHYAADQGKFIRDVAERMQGRTARKRILEDAREYYGFSAEDLDAQENLFNVQNGVLDLDALKLLEHDPNFLLSNVANVSFDPDADNTLWLDTIDTIFRGDADLIRFIHQLYGMSLTCYTGEEQFYLEYGRTTRNGKSTINDVIAYLMGDYAVNIQPETLMRKKKDSRQATDDVARLKGKRLVICSEPDKKSAWDVALIKQFTGGDLLTARHLHERFFQFRPVFKMIINTNHLPVVSDSTLFDSDRVLVIPFEKHFTAAERDKNLKRKLKNKENLSGILNCLLKGLVDFKEHGLIVPKAVTAATEDYSQREDKTMMFFRDQMDEITQGKLQDQDLWTISDAYEEYHSWCDEVGLGTDSKKNFIEEVKKRGFYQDRGYIGGRQFSRLIRLKRVLKVLKESEPVQEKQIYFFEPLEDDPDEQEKEYKKPSLTFVRSEKSEKVFQG